MPGKVTPMNPKLAVIADIEIAESGRFKYILCKVYEGKNTKDYKHIVRGDGRAEFHSDIYDNIDADFETNGVTCECIGGGKMQHIPEEKSIHVFGKSEGYGQANHSISVDILKKHYPDYTKITWDND